MAVSTPSRSQNTLIALEMQNGVERVRLMRTREQKGSVMVDLGSEPQTMVVVTSGYLDGQAHRVADAGSYHQETEVPFDVVPARTKNVTDFGRLSIAAKSLAKSMAAFSPANPPSPEQLAMFVDGYRNLLEWRQQARDQITRAEGEIDIVEILLAQMI